MLETFLCSFNKDERQMKTFTGLNSEEFSKLLLILTDSVDRIMRINNLRFMSLQIVGGVKDFCEN